MKEMYEDEGLDGWNAEEIQTILAECESNIKIADDFILSRGRLQLDMGEGFGNDFANKFPFIDDERTIVSPTDEENGDSINMSPEQIKKLNAIELL